MNDSRMAVARTLPAPGFSRAVRTREILRVVATFEGSDQLQEAIQAQQEVLRWAQKRSAGKLPTSAWNGEAFEHLGGGRTVLAVRLEDPEGVTWALRADDPDKGVPGRIWTTEATIRTKNKKPPLLSVRQLVSSREADMRISPHVPGLLQQIAEKTELTVGGLSIQAKPIRIRSESDVQTLIELLQHQDRSLPVIVASGDERASDPAAPLIDVDQLAKATLGLALVVVVPASFTYAVSDAFGKTRSVYHGAVRVYRRGFDESADPYEHRLFLGNSLGDYLGAIQTGLRNVVAKESLFRIKSDGRPSAFAAVRSEAAKRAQEAVQHGSEEELVAARKRIEALTKEVEAKSEEVDQFMDVATEEEERAELAEAVQHGLRARLGALEKALSDRGIEPDDGIEYPETWEDFTTWCDEALAGHLVLGPQARRGVKKATFGSPSVAAECLYWLAFEGRRRRMEGGGTMANESIKRGIANAPCGNDSFEFVWQERRMTADWHIKSGGNTRDPERCLRIYYCFDQGTLQFIVADMPAHRKTGAS